jgi:hypothetical protein
MPQDPGAPNSKDPKMDGGDPHGAGKESTPSPAPAEATIEERIAELENVVKPLYSLGETFNENMALIQAFSKSVDERLELDSKAINGLYDMVSILAKVVTGTATVDDLKQAEEKMEEKLRSMEDN